VDRDILDNFASSARLSQWTKAEERILLNSTAVL